jgi:hypothetical protein
MENLLAIIISMLLSLFERLAKGYDISYRLVARTIQEVYD